MASIPTSVSDILAELAVKGMDNPEADAANEESIESNRFMSDEKKAELKAELRARKQQLRAEAKARAKEFILRKLNSLNLLLESLTVSTTNLLIAIPLIPLAFANALLGIAMATSMNAGLAALQGAQAQFSSIKSLLADCNSSLAEVDSLQAEIGLPLLGAANPLPIILAPIKASLATANLLMGSVDLSAVEEQANAAQGGSGTTQP